MHRDDLLSQIRICARLHGRNEAGRVLQAVMHALRGLIPGPAYDDLTRQLPAGLDVIAADRGPAGDGTGSGAGTWHRLVHDVAEELHVEEPDAAFYTRITLGRLNAFCRGITPAQLAEGAPDGLRPLLCARTDDPAHRAQHLLTMLGPAVTTLSLRPSPAPPGAVAPTEIGRESTCRTQHG